MAANALELARHGCPSAVYLTGQGQAVQRARGRRTRIDGAGQERREVELTAPPETKPTEAELPEPLCPAGVVTSRVGEGFEDPAAPGESALDDGLEDLRQSLTAEEGGDA